MSSDSWQGDVPSHWRKTSLKYLGEYQNGYAFKPTDWGEIGRPIIRIAQLTSDAAPNLFAGKLDEKLKVEDGDLLFSWSATIDTYIWSSGPSWLNQHIFKVTPSADANKKFLFYLIKHVAPKLADVDAHGSTMRHIKKEDLGERVYVPDIEEQEAIAKFLDAETSKIDALVAEQRRLIELLAEKRQAVISHAVTKGLDPHVRMKPSGIEWLGDVPEHWEVKKIKHSVLSIEQGWSPQCENDPVDSEKQWGVLKVGCVNYGKFNADENKALPTDLEAKPELSIVQGDLLISRANTIELVGSAAVAERDYPNLMLCDKLYRLRLNLNVLLPQFLCHFLTSELAREPIELGASGASPSMKNIAQSVITDLYFAAPDIAEQRRILDSLGSTLSELDHLALQVDQSIALLQERRTALISAAVTGKIDVREFASEETV
ncbi:restriction endonuclease subunit S [Bremerella cremea]|uniref:restriction endonuclease subunit S n=1 Tax=Bremerella cremea TaxID=1031537 RepID=UPI0018F67B6C|nr:restriction endonuclease subunit S [Bremerella cremea]